MSFLRSPQQIPAWLCLCLVFAGQVQAQQRFDCQSLKWQSRWQSIGVKVGGGTCPISVGCPSEVPHLLFLWLLKNTDRRLKIINIGGEGEFAIRDQTVININLKSVALNKSFRTSRGGLTWKELQEQHDHQHQQFQLVDDIGNIEAKEHSVDLIFTESIPLDQKTHAGTGPQTENILKILSPKGLWIHNGGIIRKGSHGEAITVSQSLTK